ncbi:MAG: hypothetical protein HGA85_09095 [Nanoarchaeota archaeon]|nr:hypothetical protein [Nanoarchaeota archaeon]
MYFIGPIHQGLSGLIGLSEALSGRPYEKVVRLNAEFSYGTGSYLTRFEHANKAIEDGLSLAQFTLFLKYGKSGIFNIDALLSRYAVGQEFEYFPKIAAMAQGKSIRTNIDLAESTHEMFPDFSCSMSSQLSTPYMTIEHNPYGGKTFMDIIAQRARQKAFSGIDNPHPGIFNEGTYFMRRMQSIDTDDFCFMQEILDEALDWVKWDTEEECIMPHKKITLNAKWDKLQTSSTIGYYPSRYYDLKASYPILHINTTTEMDVGKNLLKSSVEALESTLFNIAGDVDLTLFPWSYSVDNLY